MKTVFDELAEKLETWAKTRDDESDRIGIAYGVDKFERTRWLHEAAAILRNVACKGAFVTYDPRESCELCGVSREDGHEVDDRDEELIRLLTPRFHNGIPTFVSVERGKDGQTTTATICGSHYDRVMSILRGERVVK